MKNLELAWEAVQDIYTTHANIYAYRYGLKTFCSFGEKTYLIKIAEKKIQAFYDRDESAEAAKLGLQDFLRPDWRDIFKRKSNDAITKAKIYTKNYHLVSGNLPEPELYARIKEGTEIHGELFLVFAACQPQYTSLVEEYVKQAMSDNLSAEEKNKIFLTLTQSEKITPLITEEVEWSRLVKESKVDFSKDKLNAHAREYGLLGSADGLEPWSTEFLEKRLQASLQDEEVLLREERWQAQQTRIFEEKQSVIEKYNLSPKIINWCSAIAELGHLRLCLRVEGWMPLAYIIMSELFPQLPNYLPYTVRQLECCIHTELYKIFAGDRTLTPEKLEERSKRTLYGLIDGQEVFWSGEEAKKMIAQLIPVVDTTVRELKGQTGWPGYVQGTCFVIHWDADDFLQEVASMPDGAVLVVGQTRPQLMAAIKKASAIVTDEGGLLSHAAIVSRELGKPSVIGTKFATKVFKTGDLVEVDAERGVVRILEK